jgi:hypothetical protein
MRDLVLLSYYLGHRGSTKSGVNTLSEDFYAKKILSSVADGEAFRHDRFRWQVDAVLGELCGLVLSGPNAIVFLQRDTKVDPS